MAFEEGGKAANATIEALKNQPLALALVIVNVLFLIAGLYFLHDLAGNTAATQARKDQLISDMMEKCLYAVPKKE